MKTEKQKRLAIILLVIGTMFWGMTFVFIKEAVASLSVSTFLFYRFALASLSLALIFYKRLANISINTIYKASLLAIPLCIGFITQTVGVKYTTASKAAFITGLAVVIVPVIVSCINRSLPKYPTVLAVIMALSGLALITLTGSLSLNVGDLWVLICAFAFAVYVVMVARESGKHDSVLLTLVQMLIVTIFSFFVSLADGGLSVPTNYEEWRGIIFCALFATTFMYTVQNHYQQFISATTTAIIFSLEPLFAVITAAIVLNEVVTFKIIVGGTLIIGGMICSELLQKKRSRRLTAKDKIFKNTKASKPK